MTTKIRMYHCGFGDCYRLTDKNAKHLYVDFGIHRHCPNIDGWKQKQYAFIIDDMPSHADFLLTHYHYDYYAGLNYMIEHRKYRFQNVYIPDIWKISNRLQVVHLFLYKDLLSKTVLHNGRSFISFLILICHCYGNIFFIKRNEQIQNDYIALWPSEDFVNKAANKLHKRLSINELPFYAQLDNIANQLCALMSEIGEEPNEFVDMETQIAESKSISRLQTIGIFKQLEQQLTELAKDIKVNKAHQIKLGEFAHTINIIFHNKDLSEQNILFTGDADNSNNMWDMIIHNEDCKIPFHPYYDVIKLPHHGTKSHYYDFTNIVNDNSIFLIPNGYIRRWPIARQYAMDANEKAIKVICAHHNACMSSHPTCQCKKHRCIYPQRYTDIKK